MPLILFVALVSALGCGGGDARHDAGGDSSVPDTCPSGLGFVGDPAAEPAMELIEIVLPEGTHRPISDGDAVTLSTPPQGGKTLLIGALLSNIDLANCRVQMAGQLRDPTDPQEVGILDEERRVFYEPDPDRAGWARPFFASSELDQGINLDTPGNTISRRDIDGCEWIVSLGATDATGRRAEGRVRVIPTCQEDDPGTPEVPEDLELELCQCQMTPTFVRGSCESDGALETWKEPPSICD